VYLSWKKSAIKPVVAVFYRWDTSVIIAGGDIAQNIFKSEERNRLPSLTIALKKQK
jgi:hypothetical protein